MTTQYRESDFAFLKPLLAEEGLFCWFEHQADAGEPLGSHPDSPACFAGREDPAHTNQASLSGLKSQQLSISKSGQGGLNQLVFDDTGIGISSEVQERLFSPFEQADNSLTRNYGGTGLGLVITRRLAELMGGQAGMSSVEGGGSNFWFTARLKKGSVVAQASEYRECAEEAIRQRHAGKRILLAEDEPINQEITYTLLVDVGLEVDCADDGELALEKAQQRSYALVLMDVQMPVLDGLRATQKIRQLPSYQKTPILAMTANAFTDDKDRCFDAGMDDFMTKPVMPEIFYAMLLKWLERRLH